MDRELFSRRIGYGALFANEIIEHFQEEQMEVRELDVNYFSTGYEDYDIFRQKDCWLFQQGDSFYLFLDNGKVFFN